MRKNPQKNNYVYYQDQNLSSQQSSQYKYMNSQGNPFFKRTNQRINRYDNKMERQYQIDEYSQLKYISQDHQGDKQDGRDNQESNMSDSEQFKDLVKQMEHQAENVLLESEYQYRRKRRLEQQQQQYQNQKDYYDQDQDYGSPPQLAQLQLLDYQQSQFDFQSQPRNSKALSKKTNKSNRINKSNTSKKSNRSNFQSNRSNRSNRSAQSQSQSQSQSSVMSQRSYTPFLDKVTQVDSFSYDNNEEVHQNNQINIESIGRSQAIRFIKQKQAQMQHIQMRKLLPQLAQVPKERTEHEEYQYKILKLTQTLHITFHKTKQMEDKILKEYLLAVNFEDNAVTTNKNFAKSLTSSNTSNIMIVHNNLLKLFNQIPNIDGLGLSNNLQAAFIVASDHCYTLISLLARNVPRLTVVSNRKSFNQSWFMQYPQDYPQYQYLRINLGKSICYDKSFMQFWLLKFPTFLRVVVATFPKFQIPDQNVIKPILWHKDFKLKTPSTQREDEISKNKRNKYFDLDTDFEITLKKLYNSMLVSQCPKNLTRIDLNDYKFEGVDVILIPSMHGIYNEQNRVQYGAMKVDKVIKHYIRSKEFTLKSSVVKTDCRIENQQDIQYIQHVVSAFNNSTKITKDNFFMLLRNQKLQKFKYGNKSITVESQDLNKNNDVILYLGQVDIHQQVWGAPSQKFCSFINLGLGLLFPRFDKDQAQKIRCFESKYTIQLPFPSFRQKIIRVPIQTKKKNKQSDEKGQSQNKVFNEDTQLSQKSNPDNITPDKPTRFRFRR